MHWAFAESSTWRARPGAEMSKWWAAFQLKGKTQAPSSFEAKFKKKIQKSKLIDVL